MACLLIFIVGMRSMSHADECALERCLRKDKIAPTGCAFMHTLRTELNSKRLQERAPN
jgi:cobalamin biosynthesis protein CbiG